MMRRPVTQRPPYGACFPVKFRRARDGDTISVSLVHSDRQWFIRLHGVDTPERGEPGFADAKQLTERLCREAELTDDLAVFIPRPADLENLLANVTFDRLPGLVFLNESVELGDVLVRRGLGQYVDID